MSARCYLTPKPIRTGTAYKAMNRVFYLKRSTVYKDGGFATLVEYDPTLAQLGARDYAARNELRPQIEILELGTPSEQFSIAFLNELEQLVPGAGAKIRYTFGNYSELQLQGLREKLDQLGSPHGVAFDLGLVDAEAMGSSSLAGREFDLIRFNELYDDLETQAMRRDRSSGRLLISVGHPYVEQASFLEQYGREQLVTLQEFFAGNSDVIEKVDAAAIKEVEFKLSEEEIDLAELPFGDFLNWYMSELTTSGPVPINIGAMRNLSAAAQILRQGGVMETFDYGYAASSMYFAGGGNVFRFAVPGQPTASVNFWLLEEFAKTIDLQVKVEPMTRYVSDQLGAACVLTRDMAGKAMFKELGDKTINGIPLTGEITAGRLGEFLTEADFAALTAFLGEHGLTVTEERLQAGFDKLRKPWVNDWWRLSVSK